MNRSVSSRFLYEATNQRWSRFLHEATGGKLYAEGVRHPQPQRFTPKALTLGTDKPTRAMIEENDDLFEMLERGQGVYVIAYENDQPSQIYFARYSYD